jgi:PAS domain-containing protein
MTSATQLFFVALAAAASAAAILFGLAAFTNQRRLNARALMREAESSVVFLFDDVDLIDATPAARALIRRRTPDQSDWEGFLSAFAPHFRDLRKALSTLAVEGRKSLTGAAESGTRIEAEYWNGLARISFHDESAPRGSPMVDRAALAAAEEELSTLRSIADDAPQLIWKQESCGTITWANMAYLDLAERTPLRPAESVAAWPPPILFPELAEAKATAIPQHARVSLNLPDRAEPLWFEVTSLHRSDESIHFAVDACAMVKAEVAQRNFVQTLGKTFAHLSIGLAIFDRQRRLFLFNPAFHDLTGLPIEFLSSSPLVHTVLDRLREARMLPEPKNYTTWREEIAALENAAKDGSYCETWNLPNGQTYRVTGRPHPEGAVAFLFEDISAEVSLTRRFRSEVVAGQAVLDNIDEAICVFSSSGTMTLTNAAYRALWHPSDGTGSEPLPQRANAVRATGSRLEEMSIASAAHHWQSCCAPTSLWGEVRNLLEGCGDRAEWTETVVLNDGRTLSCRFAPLPDGAALLAFRLTPDAVPVVAVDRADDDMQARRA